MVSLLWKFKLHPLTRAPSRPPLAVDVKSSLCWSPKGQCSSFGEAALNPKPGVQLCLSWGGPYGFRALISVCWGHRAASESKGRSKRAVVVGFIGLKLRVSGFGA